MLIEFDFRFYSDPKELTGSQYFEFAPGPHTLQHRLHGWRYIDEYTFCLIEGIFEARLDDYDHFAFTEVSRTQWQPILSDLRALLSELNNAADRTVVIPFGSTLRVEESFHTDRIQNQMHLSVLITELLDWLSLTLHTHDRVCVLGL